MTTMEFNLYKQELLRGIAAAETFEEAHKAWEAMCRKVNRRVRGDKKKETIAIEENLRAYTKEEIDGIIDRAETDFQAGRVYTNEESNARIRTKYPWLG